MRRALRVCPDMLRPGRANRGVGVRSQLPPVPTAGYPGVLDVQCADLALALDEPVTDDPAGVALLVQVLQFFVKAIGPVDPESALGHRTGLVQ